MDTELLDSLSLYNHLKNYPSSEKHFPHTAKYFYLYRGVLEFASAKLGWRMEGEDISLNKRKRGELIYLLILYKNKILYLRDLTRKGKLVSQLIMMLMQIKA